MVRGIRIRRGFAGWKLPQLPLLALLIPEPRDSQAPTPKQNHSRRGSGPGSQLSSQRPTLQSAAKGFAATGPQINAYPRPRPSVQPRLARLRSDLSISLLRAQG
ncbi:hypothetical protein L207DRAFT_517604 [Hyaloscypha variabilis F]|uniref:Uncharacterized protein n=1 Tax=Hyaloscypha variabilis (strain UAMH 11265 / GT02V1 / F) TaxID=1149755 RepID=A0A2J6R7H5_HYAVF|nr:hypothetical protein L207DRAFT_517604 [Hyaloscypha variabilis F]